MSSSRTRRLKLESLENRRILAADLAAGILTVTGTSKNDAIDLAVPVAGDHVGELQVNINGDFSYFDPAQVTSIRILGLNGNDEITIANDIAIDAWVSGGNGKDSITGGGGGDTLLGGNGKDTIRGGDGDDSLYGDNGNDDLDGEDGDDYLDGGNGKDNCKGGIGNDRIKGGSGKDALDGGPGNNLLDADRGKDSKDNGIDADLDNELRAVLAGASGSGKAEYESEFEDNLSKLKFELEVEDLSPNTVYDVVIDGTTVAQLTTDGNGDAELKFSSAPDDPGELAFPINFPMIETGATVSVGEALTGVFAPKHNQNAH